MSPSSSPGMTTHAYGGAYARVNPVHGVMRHSDILLRCWIPKHEVDTQTNDSPKLDERLGEDT